MMSPHLIPAGLRVGFHTGPWCSRAWSPLLLPSAASVATSMNRYGLLLALVRWQIFTLELSDLPPPASAGDATSHGTTARQTMVAPARRRVFVLMVIGDLPRPGQGRSHHWLPAVVSPSFPTSGDRASRPRILVSPAPLSPDQSTTIMSPHIQP